MSWTKLISKTFIAQRNSHLQLYCIERDGMCPSSNFDVAWYCRVTFVLTIYVL